MQQTEFETRLRADVGRIEEALTGYLSGEAEAQNAVWEAMRYSVRAGGKRIRPVLTLAFCRMLGGEPQAALPFACALEMIHAYSLIHDDLPCMDDDDLRRGQPSCHIRFGEANALLAGDGLLTLAFHTAATAPKLTAEQIVQGVRVLSDYAGVNGMVGGQCLDLEYENKPASASVLQTIHARKTGALLSAACLLGAIAADADPSVREKAVQYGKTLGLAFQIVDDILDVVGDEQTLGKPVGSDASNCKTTFVTLYGVEQAKRYAQRYTDEALDLLRGFEDSAFLCTLTETLLTRKQ